jgi:hypothetical protein
MESFDSQQTQRRYHNMMHQKTLASLFALTVALGLSLTATAQHGGGRPAGAGAGLGAGAGVGAGVGASANGLDHAQAGAATTTHGSINTGAQAPSSALSNTHLSSSLTSALTHSGITIPGGNLQTACSGFKNLGQCVAALHVSKNLGLSFTDLQSKMSGSGAESLGKAIQDLGGANVNAKTEAKKGTKQANADLSAAATAS